MKRWLIILFALVAPAQADVIEPIVRVEATPAQVMVGQPVQLRVTVLVPTWFTKPSAYPSFELANTITRLPPDSSFNTTDRIDGETWTGIVRDYQINPQIAATYNLEGLSVRVNYAHPETRQSTPADVKVPPVRFRAIVPPGAEDLDPFLAGTQGTLEREVDGDLEALQAGDAIVITATAKLRGMPAMFMPELIAPTEQPGLTAYPKEPVVANGEFASRTEEVTYVFSGGGTFTLPALDLAWWNPDSEAIDRATLPALVVTVTGAPALIDEAPATPTAPTPMSWVVIAGWILGLFASAGGVLLLVRIARALGGWRTARREQYRASEPFAFRALTQAATRNDPGELDSALHVWLSRLDGCPTLQQLSTVTGEPLYADILALNRRRHSADAQTTQPDTMSITNRLRKARASYLDQRRGRRDDALPPLNPAAGL